MTTNSAFSLRPRVKSSPKSSVAAARSARIQAVEPSEQRGWSRKSARGCFCIILLIPCVVIFPPLFLASAQQRYDDHQNMMDQLGVKAIRRGPDPNNQSTFDEAIANPYKDSMPDPLRMKDSTRVTRAKQWPKRRAEIVEDFEREVYGRIPKNVPKVTWEVTATTPGTSGGVPILTRTLVGHVDNSAYPQVTVNIQANFTVPADAKKPVPIMIEFDFGGPGFVFRRTGVTPWTEQAIANGWGYGTIVPNSIQPDNNQLKTGIIGLTNKGQPRKPDDWGALRAWQWGVSRLIDYFEANRDTMVDPRKVGIEGLSRYGKAAIVTEAFDRRVAVGLIGSSGEGGVKLHRHIFGEAVENLAGGEYYWMAGNFIKYGASDPPKTAADLPVDSHELIALCAPRPCFISYGTTRGGDPNWVDAHGSFMAAVLAGPVYRLLGKKDLGTPGDYLTDPMPPVKTLIGGELAWRQHEGGHDVTPNWPSFFDWVQHYVKAPAAPHLPLSVFSRAPSDQRGSSAERRLGEGASINTTFGIPNPPTTGPPNPPTPFPTGEGGGVTLRATPVLADAPVPRTDANSRLAHTQLVEKAKHGGIDLYFVGDSIVRRWGCSDPQYAELLANWKHNFYGWNAGNFGWGADRIENILWRMENGELDGVNPKTIVVLAGTNNIGPQPADDAEMDVTKGIQMLLRVCKEKAPGAVIILTAILPRNDNMSAMPIIVRINENLAKLADGKSIRFLNVNDKLADTGGHLFDGMMNHSDKLHPTVRGYQVWANGLKPILMQLLGPPAATDHAPLPTGNPGA